MLDEGVAPASGSPGKPLSKAGGAVFISGKPEAPARGTPGEGNSDWGGNIGEVLLVGSPFGIGGKDMSPEDGADMEGGSKLEVVSPGRAGSEESAPGKGGRPESVAPGAGGSDGKPPELSPGKDGIPESGAPVAGNGGIPLSFVSGGSPEGEEELSPGNAGRPFKPLSPDGKLGVEVFGPKVGRPVPESGEAGKAGISPPEGAGLKGAVESIGNGGRDDPPVAAVPLSGKGGSAVPGGVVAVSPGKGGSVDPPTEEVESPGNGGKADCPGAVEAFCAAGGISDFFFIAIWVPFLKCFMSG